MPKKELIRIVRTPDEAVMIDLTGKSRAAALIYAAKFPASSLHTKIKLWIER